MGRLILTWTVKIAAGSRKSSLDSRSNAVQPESAYICDHCGEEIVVPVDLSAGAEQTYVEDCPVCCSPNVIHVQLNFEGDARVWSEPE